MPSCKKSLFLFFVPLFISHYHHHFHHCFCHHYHYIHGLLLTVQCLKSSYHLAHKLWSHLCNKCERAHASHQVNTADVRWTMELDEQVKHHAKNKFVKILFCCSCFDTNKLCCLSFIAHPFKSHSQTHSWDNVLFKSPVLQLVILIDVFNNFVI